MYYKLCEIRINKIDASKATTADGSNEYVSAVVFNPNNIHETRSSVAFFEKSEVAMYKKFLPKVYGGSQDIEAEDWNEESLPLALREFRNGQYVAYDLGEPMFRKYTRPVKKGDQTIHNTGDWICGSDGKARVYRQVTVLCQYNFLMKPLLKDGMIALNEQGEPIETIQLDELGNPKWDWASGWGPEERGLQIKAKSMFSLPYLMQQNPDLVPQQLLGEGGIATPKPEPAASTTSVDSPL